MKIYPVLMIVVFSLIACAPKYNIPNSPDADRAKAAYQKGMAAKDRGDYETALNAMTRAQELAPNTVYLAGAGEMAFFLGRYDKAIAYLEEALLIEQIRNSSEHPNVATLWNNLGLAWQAKGDYDKAIMYYEKALASNMKTFGPDDPQLVIYWTTLGQALRQKGEYDQAIEYFEKSLASNKKTLGPDHRNVAIDWNNLGLAKHDKGEYGKAMAYFTKALEVFKKIKLEAWVRVVEKNIRTLPPSYSSFPNNR